MVESPRERCGDLLFAGLLLAIPFVAACGESPTPRVGLTPTVTVRTPPPEKAEAGTTPIGVAAGYGHSCLWTDGGRVACWGLNADGQLGDGTRQNRAAPRWIDVREAVRVVLGHAHSCVLHRSGGVSCWGRAFADRPSRVKGVPAAGHIASSEWGVCVLAEKDGVPWCWQTSPYDARAGGWPKPQAVPNVKASRLIASPIV